MLSNCIPFGETKEKNIVMVVAYPGDETLWAGGSILSRNNWRWHIVSVFMSTKADSRAHFNQALERLGVTGESLDLPQPTGKQTALHQEALDGLSKILEKEQPDVLLTHNPNGESRRLHGRDKLGRIIGRFWEGEKIATPALWFFAYEDENEQEIPYAVDDADRSICLSSDVWKEKRSILMDVYGFTNHSFAARVCPKEEAFYCIGKREALSDWYKSKKRRVVDFQSHGSPRKKRVGPRRSTA